MIDWLDRQARYIDVGGAVCWVREYGVKGAPTICFLHPPLLTSANFIKQFRSLSAFYHLVAFDIRGHGKSSLSCEPLDYRLIIRDLLRILDELGVASSCLFGYSTGGAVALQALAEHPGRFAGAVVVSGMAEVADLKLFTRMLIAIGLAKKKRIPWLNALVSGGNSDTPLVFYRLWKEARLGDARLIRQYYEAGLQTDLLGLLPAIRQPVLLVYGEQDLDFHRYALQLQARLPNSSLHVLAGHKHRLPTYAADELNRLVHQWLQRTIRRESVT